LPAPAFGSELDETRYVGEQQPARRHQPSHLLFEPLERSVSRNALATLNLTLVPTPIVSSGHQLTVGSHVAPAGPDELAPAGGILGAGLTSCAWPRPVRPGDELRVESKGELRSLLVGVACPARNGGPDGFEPVFESRPRFRSRSLHVTGCLVPEKSTRLKHAGA